MEKPYDVVVSLGGHCKPAWHIRERFGIARAMPFDWWIASPEAVARIIREGHSGLFDARNLRTIWDGTSVMDTHWNVIHHHDFQRGPDGLITLPLDPQIASAKRKFDILFDRFDAECKASGHLLFVHAVPGHDVHPANSGRHQVVERAVALHGALEARFARQHVDLLFLDGGPHAPESVSSDRGTISFANVTFDGNSGDAWLSGPYRALFKRWNIRMATTGTAAVLDDMLHGEAWR